MVNKMNKREKPQISLSPAKSKNYQQEEGIIYALNSYMYTSQYVINKVSSSGEETEFINCIDPCGNVVFVDVSSCKDKYVLDFNSLKMIKVKEITEEDMKIDKSILSNVLSYTTGETYGVSYYSNNKFLFVRRNDDLTNDIIYREYLSSSESRSSSELKSSSESRTSSESRSSSELKSSSSQLQKESSKKDKNGEFQENPLFLNFIVKFEDIIWDTREEAEEDDFNCVDVVSWTNTMQDRIISNMGEKCSLFSGNIIERLTNLQTKMQKLVRDNRREVRRLQETRNDLLSSCCDYYYKYDNEKGLSSQENNEFMKDKNECQKTTENIMNVYGRISSLFSSVNKILDTCDSCLENDIFREESS